MTDFFLQIFHLKAILRALLFSFGCFAFFLMASPAHAAVRTWDGGGSTNNWSEAANWSSDTVPTGADVATFDGTSTKDATIDSGVGFGGTVLGIDINTGYTGTITQARSITMTSSGFDQADGTFTGNSSTFDDQANFTLTGGTFNAPTASFFVFLNVTVSGGTLNGTGDTLTFTSYCGGSTTFTYAGNFNADTGLAVVYTKVCGGFFTVASGTTLTASFTNDAQLTVQSGATLTTTGNFTSYSLTNEGSFTLGAGSFRTFGPATFDGTTNDLTAATGTSIEVDTALTIGTGRTLLLNAAITTVSIAGNYTNNGTFNISGRTLNFFGCATSSQISYSGNFNADTGASVTVTKVCNGAFTVPSGQTLTITTTGDPGIVVQSGGILTVTGNFVANTLSNLGSLTISGGTCFTFSNATFGGTVNDFGGCTSFQIGNILTINSGTTLTLNPAVTTVSVAGDYVNNGTFDLTGRTLNFYGCGSSSQIVGFTGNFNTATGANVSITKVCNGLFTTLSGQTIAITTTGDPGLVIQSGGVLTTTGNFVVNTLSNLGSLTVGSGTCFSYSTMTFGGTTNDLGACTSLQVSGTLIINSGVTLTLNPAVTTIFLGSNYENNGTFNISGRLLNFYGCGGGQITGFTGNFNTATGASVTITKSCNAPFTFLTGQTITATTVNDPGIVIQSGATFLVSGSFVANTMTNAGTFIADTSTCYVISTSIFGGTTNDLTNCTATTFQGNMTVSSGKTLALSGAAVTAYGDLTNNGTITTVGTPTLTFLGTFQNSTVTDSVGQTWPFSFVLNKNIGNFTLGSNLTIAGSFTRTQEAFTNPASPYTLRIAGDFSAISSAAFGGSNLTIELNGTGTQNIISEERNIDANFVVNKASGEARLTGAASFTTGTCTVAVGTFALNGNAFSCLPGFTVNSGATLKLNGDELVTTPTLNTGSTVLYVGDGDSAADTFSIRGFTYSNLTIAPTDSNDTFGPTGNSPLTRGLVAYYPFDEGSGSTTADGSGNGYTGTLTNMEAGDWSTDVPSSSFSNPYSLDFDGTNENVDLGNPSLLPAGANPRTVCAWGKTDTLSANAWLASYGTSIPSQPFSLGRVGAQAYGNGFFNDIGSNGFWSTGTWEHLCFVYTGTRERLYGNGSLLAYGNFTLNTTRLRAKIASYIENFDYWDGKIDEVRFYDRVLSSAEIAALASGDNLTPSTLTTLTVNGNLTLSSGTLTLPTGTTTLNGNLIKTGGTVDPNGGTVNLGTTDTTLSGAWTFSALTKSVSAAHTLTLPTSSTTTVTGNLTLNGTSGNLLSLRSSSSGVQANLNSSGSRTLSYLDVQDSHGTNAAKLNCGLTCVNSGNNTNWVFGPGVTLTDISGDTTEAGGTAFFTAVLDVQPTSNVTIPVSSSDTSEGTVSTSSLLFTNANWDTPQTVTVTGVDDMIADGDVVYTVILGPATSSDVTYSGLDPSDVSVTNLDDDSAAIIVSSISGNTTEAGATATFTVVLATQPTASVSIGITSSDTTEGTVSTSSLVFTTGNWDTPQTVTVTGVDDFLDDGDISYSIITAPASSSDTVYDGMNAADVSLSNIDNDTFGITVSPTSGHTTEAGGTASFTVTLNSQPTATVSINVSSSDTSEGTVPSVPSPLLTFTTGNWSTPHTVTVTGVDDFIDDGDVIYTIVLDPAVSTDPQYSGLDAPDVSVTNDDNETVGFNVSAISGNTTESGGTATFTVALGTQPTGDVTLPVSSSDTSEGTVAISSLTFTNGNWDTPQTVTVTGVDDALDDGDVAYSIVLGAATSTDTDYNGLNPPDVSVTNTDNDTVGVTVSAISGNTTEAGGTATFTVVLTSQPTADVNIPVSSNDTTEGTVAISSLTFTNGNWSTPQTVTVTGVNDDVDDGDISYSIVLAAATSVDSAYNGFNPNDVSVTNTDNDTAAINVSAISGNTSEVGTTATFTIVLNSQPTADVSMGLSSSDTTEGTIAVSSVTFTTGNWNIAQTITVTGQDDAVNDGDVVYSIVTAPATSADPLYNGYNPTDVSVTNIDDENAGFNVSSISGHTTEAGGTATFTVSLLTQPSGDVTIPLSSNDTTEGTIAVSSLVFTNGNWNIAQTVTVTGADDQIDDGNITYSIVLAPATSTDTDYNGLNPVDVSVINDDNDISGYNVTAPSGNTTEAGATATFTVVLLTQPVADVTIPVTSGDATEGSVSPSSLTFTSANWFTPQTVTVTGVNDDIDDGNITYSILLGAATSADPTYNTLDPNDPSLQNLDNDTAGVVVTESAGSTNISEDGVTDSYDIVLVTQPAANVTITMFPDSQVQVDTPSVQFTSGNWNVPRTITVSAVDDSVAEGTHTGTVAHTASSGDSAYNGIAVASVVATITDNDTAGGSGGGGGYIPPQNVQNPSRVTVQAPMEGDVLTGGQTFLITWSMSGEAVPYADLYYSIDGGTNFVLIEQSVRNTGTYSWLVPRINTSSAVVKVVATDLVNQVTEDVSGVFNIQTIPAVTDDNRPLPATGPSPVTGLTEIITPVKVGDYIRSPFYPTVYYVDHGLIRRPFVNPTIFHTYEPSFSVVKMVTDATLPVLPLGQPMLPKPHVVLVKIQSTPQVYAIGLGDLLRLIPDEATAAKLFGSNWADYVIDLDPTLLRQFTIGLPMDGTETIDRSVLIRRVDLQ